MANSVSDESGVDRISALPDELLCQILSFLPTKTAVCTSVLSKRWRRLYTLVSTLDIVADIPSNDVEKPKWLLTFVNRALVFRSGPRIQRFHLKWYHYIDPWKIYGWIAAILLCHNIQEFELCNKYPKPYDQQIPDELFSCETLVVLKLVLGYFPSIRDIPANAFLPNLKVLKIGYATISKYDVERLLSNCPLLDDLSLEFCEFCDMEGMFRSIKFNIVSATLKRLTTRFYTPDHALQIVINCPALVYLNYSLRDKQSYTLLGKPSLSEVYICGYSPPHFRTAVYVEAHEHDVLKEIKNIQSLEIQHDSIQGFCDHNLHLPLFNKLTYLKIHNWGGRRDFVVSRCLQYLLAQCVVLETLVFEQQYPVRPQNKTGIVRFQYLLEQSQLAGLLCHLKKLKIQLRNIEDAEAKALMKIIEFFLNNAKVLEEVTLFVREFPDTRQSDMMRELSTLPRVSENCRVVLGGWRI